MKKIILFSFIFLNIANAGMMSMMSMPMSMMSVPIKTGLSMPIARDILDEGKMFAIDVFTQRNYALQNKIYLYSSITNENNENAYLSKILGERSFQFDKNSFIHIGGVASYDNNETKARIHSLYYDIDFFANSLNIKMGREIKSFGYGGHFNIIDFLSKSDSLYNMNDVFINKNSVDLMSLRLNNSSGNNYVSVYAYEDDITDDVDKSNYLIELATTSKSSKSSIFVNSSDKNLSVALAVKKHIGDDFYMKTSIRYDKNSNKHKSLSSSSSFSFNLSDNFLIGADYGAWKKDIKADNKSVIFHYIAYTKFKIGSLKVKAGYLKDEEEKANLSLWYNIGNATLYMDGFMNTQDNNKHLARFIISYLH